MINAKMSDLAHRYIIVSLGKQVLEYDLKNLRACKFPEIYLLYVRTLETKLNNELRGLRSRMKQARLKVQELKRIKQSDEIVFLISHRGFISKETYWTVALRNATRDYLISLSQSISF